MSFQGWVSRQLESSETTNRITTAGYAYDAAGNLTNDSLHAYTYDAENRIKALDATAATYTYSGPMRVKKAQGSTNTVYIFSGSKVIAEYVNGALSREYIYLGNQLLYTVRIGAVDTYHHFDHLSTRMETRTDGAVEQGYAHFPFGETWYDLGNALPTGNKYKFTSYERDQESGLDQAMFRYYSPRIARFMSADPLSGQVTAPQSLNRYAYVVNDPVNLVDSMGLDHCYTICTDDGLGNRSCETKCDSVFDASHGSGPDAFDNVFGWLRWRGFFALLEAPSITGFSGVTVDEKRNCIKGHSLSSAQRATLTALGFWAQRSGGTRGLGVGVTGGAGLGGQRVGGGGSASLLWVADHLGGKGLYWSVSGGPVAVNKPGGAAILGGLQYLTSSSSIQEIAQSPGPTVGGSAAVGLGAGVDYAAPTNTTTGTLGVGVGAEVGGSGALSLASGFIPICE